MTKPHQKLSTPFSFALLFENDGLIGASAHIVLCTCSKDDAGTTYITPDCKTPEEFHHQIDRLQAELERVRYQGIRAFIDNINGKKSKKKSN
jgi:hypothetical protein